MVEPQDRAIVPEGKSDDAIADVVRRSAVPTLLLEVPSEKILAASSTARALLSPTGEDLAGRNLESFAADDPTGALDLLISGRLNGYEGERRLRLSDGSVVSLRFWVKAIEEAVSPRRALVVLLNDGRPAGNAPCPLPNAFYAVIGTTDVYLTIDRVSTDIGPLFGHEATKLIGQSLFRLVHPEDLPALMWALAQSTSSGAGVALRVRINGPAGESTPSQMLLSPLSPPPSFAFALLPDEPIQDTAGADAETDLWQMRRGIEAVDTLRNVTGQGARELPGFSKLSSREIEVMARLLAGDRVPAIARSLFIAQSTVRNHLSSIFQKLGVGSQQSLIDLMRARTARKWKPGTTADVEQGPATSHPQAPRG
jgi:DNA-binding CsgD family transcriptional regulator